MPFNLLKKNWGGLTTLGACLGILILANPVDIVATIILLMAVGSIGIWKIRKLTAVCNDANLSALEYFWLIKLLLSMILVAVVWAPEIYSAGDLILTYDPIRYFYQSLALVKNGWQFHGGMNSTGILYYYGVIFFILGHNPFISALINILVTLLVITVTIYWMYGFVQKSLGKKYKLIYLILIPDFLWFDCLTSRESIAAWLILLIVISTGELFYRNHSPVKKNNTPDSLYFSDWVTIFSTFDNVATDRFIINNNYFIFAVTQEAFFIYKSIHHFSNFSNTWASTHDVS